MHQSHGAVLQATCPTHGLQTVQLCGVPGLAWRLAAPVAAATPDSSHDLTRAEAHQRLGVVAGAAANALHASRAVSAAAPTVGTAVSAAAGGFPWPAVHDIALHGTDRGLLSEGALADSLDIINPTEGRGSGSASGASLTRTLLRLRAAAGGDVVALNVLLRHALLLTRGKRLAVELAGERMAALARLPDTALLSPRVYPQLRLLVRRGHELAARTELVAALGELASFEDIAVAAELCVEKPWPDLTPLFDSLLRHKRMVRVIFVTLVRSAQQVMRAASPVSAPVFVKLERCRV